MNPSINKDAGVPENNSVILEPSPTFLSYQIHYLQTRFSSSFGWMILLRYYSRRKTIQLLEGLTLTSVSYRMTIFQK